MQGDKLIFQEQHYIKADTILPHISNKKIVAIGGESGTGKSEIAYLLRSKLAKQGVRSVVIHTDDYYKTSVADREKSRKDTGVIGLAEMDWVRLLDPINGFLDKHFQVYIRVINKFTNSSEYRIVWVNNVDTVIVEGLYALNIEQADFKIHIVGDRNSTHAFRRVRAKEPLTEFRVEVLNAEGEAVQKLRSKANLEV